MKFPKKMDFIARAALSTMQTLKSFFSRLGQASEIRIKRLQDQLKKLVERPGEPSRAILNELDTLKEETSEFYAVKNFVEKLPAGLTPPQYFKLTIELLTKLGRAEEAMDNQALYTFKYRAKTEGKYFDVHPVIMFTTISSTYFKGYNFHWERAPEYVESVHRTYVFTGVQSKFYRILPHELEEFLKIPTFMPIYIPKLY